MVQTIGQTNSTAEVDGLAARSRTEEIRCNNSLADRGWVRGGLLLVLCRGRALPSGREANIKGCETDGEW